MIFKLFKTTERKENDKLFKLKDRNNNHIIGIDTLDDLLKLINRIDIPKEQQIELFGYGDIAKKSITITQHPKKQQIRTYHARTVKQGWYLRTVNNDYKYTITIHDHFEIE